MVLIIYNIQHARKRKKYRKFLCMGYMKTGSIPVSFVTEVVHSTIIATKILVQVWDRMQISDCDYRRLGRKNIRCRLGENKYVRTSLH